MHRAFVIPLSVLSVVYYDYGFLPGWLQRVHRKDDLLGDRQHSKHFL